MIAACLVVCIEPSFAARMRVEGLSTDGRVVSAYRIRAPRRFR